jgi:hypothetical protein
MVTTVVATGPGSTTIVEDTAAAIGLQSAKQVADDAKSLAEQAAQLTETERFRNTLAAMALSLSTIADSSKAISQKLDSLNSAIGGMQTALHDQTLTMQSIGANQMKKNKFDEALTKQKLKETGQQDTLDAVNKETSDLKAIIKQDVTDGMIVHAEIKAQGFITTKIEDAIEGIQSWITNSVIYQTITGWLSKEKDIVLSFFGFSSPQKIKNDAAAIAGTPTIPDNVA